MIKLYGRRTAFHVQKVAWTLEELGCHYEWVGAAAEPGLIGIADYGAINPFGRVPSIVDGGLALSQSNSIVRYLSAKYGAGQLWPEDLSQQADADRWMDWQASEVVHALSPVFHGLTCTAPDRRNNALIEKSANKLGELLMILDDHLAPREFILGASFTAADIPLGVTCDCYYSLEVERPDLGNLRMWYDRLQKRDAYRLMVMLPERLGSSAS